MMVRKLPAYMTEILLGKKRKMKETNKTNFNFFSKIFKATGSKRLIVYNSRMGTQMQSNQASSFFLDLRSILLFHWSVYIVY
jgi:hypothetical protein